MALLMLLATILSFSFSRSLELGSESDFELANTTNSTGSCWTPYYDLSTPSTYRSWRHHRNEYELLQSHFRQGYSLCEKPINIQCVTLHGVPYNNTSDKLTCLKETGLVCRNSDQASGICQDYKVRYLCPGMCKRQCGSSLFVTSGERVFSPPEGKAPASCQWTITTLKHQRLRIKISSTRLLKGMELTVYDGKGKESVKVIQLKSRRKYGDYFASKVIFSSAKTVQVQYSARRGGVAGWTLTCTVIPAPLRFSPCRFDNGTCNWKSSNKLWKAVHCLNNGTGIPMCGLPSAGGVAVLTNSVMGSSGDTLHSPHFKAVQSKCLSVRFLINGPNDINFHVYVKAFNGTLYSSGHWRHTDNKWRKGYLKVINDVDFYVLITVTMRPKTTNVTTYNDIVAIDEIRLEKCVHDFPCMFMDGGEMDCPLTYKQGHGVWSAKSTTLQTRLLPPVLPPESFNWTSMGCWQPSTCASPMPSLERNTDILEDYPSFRSNPVARCAVAASADSHTMFAVQRYGQCHSVNIEKLARDYEKITGQCSMKNLEVGSYEIFKITAVHVTSPAVYQEVIEDVFRFVQSSVPSKPIYRSSISFKVVPPRHMPGKLSCISFRYITSFSDAWVETINYRHHIKTGISKTVWQMPDVGNDSTPVWRSANILLPTNDSHLAMERVKIRPFKTLQRGYFRVMDLVGSYPCVAEPPRNCVFDRDNCEWQSSSRLYSIDDWRRPYWNSPIKNVTGESASGYITYNGYYASSDQHKKNFVILWHPTILSKGHRCFAFHYVMSKAMEEHAGWGFSARVKVNGKIYSEVVPTNASGEWQLGKMHLPRLKGVPMQIEFQACRNCYVGLDNFIFSYQPCNSDINECRCSKERCDQICINTFGSFFCRCRQGYMLGIDNRTCIPVCQRSCLSGTCVAPNTCECLKGFTGEFCHLTCGETFLTNKTGMIRNPEKIANTANNYYINYHDKQQCDWTIRAPPGHVVTLEIEMEEANWRYTPACQYHNLTIRNKKDGNRILTNTAILCAGQFTSRRFVSTTNKLFISYYLTQSYRLFPFSLKYQIHGKFPTHAVYIKLEVTGFLNTCTEATGCVTDCSNVQWWQQCCSGYLVAVPNVFRQGANTTVDVQLQKIGYEVTVIAELVKSHQEQQLEPVQGLISGHGSLTFQIPDDFSPGKYLFKIVALNGKEVVFNQTAEVAVAPRGPTVLVQTDKPVYKPGQTVRMRIVSMDYNMKPYNGNLSVIVADGKGTKILQWLELTPMNGIIAHSLALSSQPVAGTWKITISTTSTMKSVVQVACFEVREYVLPKFEVNTFSPSSYILRNSAGNITVAVASRYSYGKSVKGSVCLKLTTVHMSSYYHYYKPKTQSFCKKINGLTDFTVDVSSLISSWSRVSYYRPQAVEVNVTVTEQGTGVMTNSSETIPIVEHEYILSFKPGTDDFYKPGLPFPAQISVATPDQRAAVDLLLVRVTVYDGWRNLYSFDGDVVNGTLEVNIFHQRNRFQSYLRIQAVISGKSAMIDHVAQPRAAAGKHYMRLTPNMTTLQPGIPSTVFIMTTGKVKNRAFALAVSRARILKSWVFKIRTTLSSAYQGVHESIMSITPLCSWAPRFHLVVYYIAEGHLVVADSISLKVEQCFQHKVEMTFSRNESRPGEKVGLFIQSAPHSHVSLTGVDKSVYLLDSDCTSQITADQVLAELLRYETGSQVVGEEETALLVSEESGSGLLSYSELNQRDWWRSWWDATNTPYYFKSAGIAVISDYLFVQKTEVQRLRRGLDSLGASGGDNVDVDSEDEGDDADQFVSVKRVRSYFPEAWLWEDKQTDENGKLSLNMTVPDTITTWIADAFAMSNTAAFGMTDVPSRLVAFKPFFISLSLPYSVVRREEVEIIATVFNYYYEDLKVVVELDVSTGGFDFVSKSTTSKMSLLVRAQDSLTARFSIRPRQLGRIPLKVTAYSRIESDAIIRLLLVEPEGVEQTYSRSSFIAGEGTETLTLDVPDPMVPESFHGVISLSGDVMGPAINSLGSTLRMPYGCGEQNMINFAPAVLIKRYLTAVGKLTSNVDVRASRYMNIGYQRELTYQRSDGSYAVWGDNSYFGSTCLTGFVCRVYAQAKPFMYIDPDSLEKSVCWLISQQSENGQFSEPGSCYHLKCGRDSMGTTLTAYTLITLLEVSRVQTIRCGSDQDAVRVAAKKSQVYLEGLKGDEMNDYVLAMTAYSLSMAKSQRAASLLTELDKRVQGKDEKRHHWTCGSSYCYGWRQRYCRQGPGTVETTAYAMLAYLEMERMEDIRPIEAWLVSQMDSRGGYRSTQDTMMALMALSEMATRVGWQAVGLTVTVSNSSGLFHIFRLDTNNKLITQNVEVDSPTTLHFHHKGVGSALLQVMVTYNVPEVDPDDSFSINATAFTPNISHSATTVPTVVTPGYSVSPLPEVPSTQPSPTTQAPTDPTTSTVNNQTVVPPTILPLDPSNNLIHLNICSSWQRSDAEPGMSIIEVGLLSGYRANQNELRELVENNDIELHRYETEGRKVVLYFDKVKESATCFSISQQRTHCVAKIQPAFIQAYSYYEPDYLTTVPYQPPSSLADSLDECERETEERESGTGSTSQPQTVDAGQDGNDGDQESVMDAM